METGSPERSVGVAKLSFAGDSGEAYIKGDDARMNAEMLRIVDFIGGNG